MREITFIRKVIRTEVVEETCVLSNDAYTTLPDWIEGADEETMDNEEFQERLLDFVHEGVWESEVRHEEFLDTLDIQIEEIFDIEIGDV